MDERRFDVKIHWDNAHSEVRKDINEKQLQVMFRAFMDGIIVKIERLN